ncbi:MAG: hypothetical protein AAFV53_38570 [Myxococcota bacterium]
MFLLLWFACVQTPAPRTPRLPNVPIACPEHQDGLSCQSSQRDVGALVRSSSVSDRIRGYRLAKKYPHLCTAAVLRAAQRDQQQGPGRLARAAALMRPPPVPMVSQMVPPDR